MLGLSASYSDTDSVKAALWGQMYGKRTLAASAFSPPRPKSIMNTMTFSAQGCLSKRRTISTHWVSVICISSARVAGSLGSGVRTNYAVGAADLFETMLNQFGLSGFDAAGVGLVFQHDTMDHQRDPSAGHLFTLHNFAYREGLGGESSFDVGFADLGGTEASAASPPKPTSGARSLLFRPKAGSLLMPPIGLFLRDSSRLHHGELSVPTLLSYSGRRALSAHTAAGTGSVWRCRLPVRRRYRRIQHRL